MLSRSSVAVVALALAMVPASTALANQGRHDSQRITHAKGVARAQQSHAKGKAQPRGERRSGELSRHEAPWTDRDRARYTPMLPAGMTLDQASAGFSSHGQFIAAVNASQEHNVSFVELKSLMVNRGMSLGDALRTFKR